VIICEIIVHLLVVAQNKKKIRIKISTSIQEKPLRGMEDYVLSTGVALFPVAERSKAEV